MKLDAEDVVVLDCGSEGFYVFSSRGERPVDFALIVADEGVEWGVIGVGEVDVFAIIDTREQAGGWRIGHVDLVPADVGDFFAGFGEAFAVAEEVAETGLIGSLGAALKQPLHAYADAEEWNAPANGGADGWGEAGFVEAARGGEVAYPREDDALGLGERLGAVCDVDFRAKVAQGFDDGGQVAGFVVDDRNWDRHQSSPLVDGNISAS